MQAEAWEAVQVPTLPTCDANVPARPPTAVRTDEMLISRELYSRGSLPCFAKTIPLGARPSAWAFQGFPNISPMCTMDGLSTVQ